MARQDPGSYAARYLEMLARRDMMPTEGGPLPRAVLHSISRGEPMMSATPDTEMPWGATEADFNPKTFADPASAAREMHARWADQTAANSMPMLAEQTGMSDPLEGWGQKTFASPQDRASEFADQQGQFMGELLASSPPTESRERPDRAQAIVRRMPSDNVQKQALRDALKRLQQSIAYAK